MLAPVARWVVLELYIRTFLETVFVKEMTKSGAQISGLPFLEVGPVLRTPANLTQTYPIRQVFCKSVSDPTCTLQCKSAILTKLREGSRSFGSGPFAKLRRRGDPSRFAEIDTEISGFISGCRLGGLGRGSVRWGPASRLYRGVGRMTSVLQFEVSELVSTLDNAPQLLQRL